MTTLLEAPAPVPVQIRPRTSLQLYHTPVPPALLYYLAEIVISDPARRICYTELFPDTAAAWLADMRAGRAVPWVWTVGDLLGGVYWLHDPGFDAGGSFAWFGTYVLPHFRKQRWHWYVAAWHCLTAQLAEEGLERIYIGIRHTNTPALRAAERCGFTCAGWFAQWHRFEGAWDHAWIWSWRAEDTDAAMVQAAQRHRAVAALVG